MNSNIIVSLVEGLIKALLGFFIKEPKEQEIEKNVNVAVQDAVAAGHDSIVSDDSLLNDDDGFKRRD